MTFKMNILASDEAQYLDADDVKTERTCLSKDGKHVVLWNLLNQEARTPVLKDYKSE